MSIWDRLDPKREASPEVVAVLDGFLTAGTLTSVHYVGYAHEPILRVLHRHLGAAFSVTDIADRFGAGAQFFWEGDGDYPGQARPDWLEGILFYQEGIPRTDLLIWDAPWRDPEQCSAIVESRKPKHLLFADAACSVTPHPAYSWTFGPGYSLGTLTASRAKSECEK